MEHEFDLFDFAAAQSSPEPVGSEAGKSEPAVRLLGKNELQQAAFAFMLSLHPGAIAANVPTRRSKYKVAAAGLWRDERSRKNNSITKTAIVVMYDDAEYCFSDCSGRDERIAAIRNLQNEKELLEADIRRSEPHLAAADDLFSEFRSWDYSGTANPEYRKVCRKLAKEIKLLTQGSKLDYIRRAGNADLCYLAVPAGLLDPDMIPSEWGIVELSAVGKRYKLIRDAEPLENVTSEGRMTLALNIAQSAVPAVRFCAGVDADGKFRRIPRRRKRL